MAKIRLLWANTGTFYGVEGLGYGDTVDVDDEYADRLVKQGLAERVRSHHGPEVVVESAVVSDEGVEFALAPEKRSPGRPRKNP